MDILYSDKNIAVIIKPVGLDSETETPAAIKQTLGGEIFPIHRLDKNVGGVMIYARTKAAAAALSKTIQEGLMIKEYVALVHGTPPENGDWEDLLFKDSRKNKVFVVKRERKGVKRPVWNLNVCSFPPPLRPLFPPAKPALSMYASTLAAATRFESNSPAGAFLWWATTNTVLAMRPQRPSSFPAVSPSPIEELLLFTKRCPSGHKPT